MNLTNEQSIFLAEFGQLKAHYNCGLLTGVVSPKEKISVKYNYNEFKKAMKLEDIRFHWLLSPSIYLAGGSVVGWISSNKFGDFDFYFKSESTATNFRSFISQYGFLFIKDSWCAKTLVQEKDGTLVQLIGAEASIDKEDSNYPSRSSFFGDPDKILDSFDINLCSFAIDNEFVYSNNIAVFDLITKQITLNYEFFKLNKNESRLGITAGRIIKYNQRGFLIPSEKCGVTDRLYFEVKIGLDKI